LDIIVEMLQLGHESRITTELYLHSINETEKIAMDLLNKEFD
jgi:hypothetical protein